MKELEHFKNYRSKNYLHIDKKISTKNKHVFELIQDEDYIRKHAFLPFIHYTINLGKYTFKEGHNNKSVKKLKLVKGFNQSQVKYFKPKQREINYASHMDSIIYKFYGEKLNELYNVFARKNGINDCSIAYRNNKKGLSNIHFAKEVFKFIIDSNDAIIIALDFTSFFDNISHKELKQTLKQVLNVSELPPDIYNVFKSITKFKYIEKDDLDKYLEVAYPSADVNKMVRKGQLHNYMDIKEFRKLIKDKKLKVYSNIPNDSGIPQGSGMSAICSNIRLINFDLEMNKWATSLNGLYRRYCDDLIWVIPKNREIDLAMVENSIYKMIEKYGDLSLQKEKTIALNYHNQQMITSTGEKSKLDYLGIVFDGATIKIREKSLFKYYSRAYKKTRSLAKKHYKFKRNAYMKQLYGVYTHLGRGYKGFGNFVTYAYRAHTIMETLPVNVLIRNQVKRHWRKIHKSLEKHKSELEQS